MKKYIFVLLVALLMVGCKPSESSVQTAVADVLAAIPTSTQYPTYTPELTQTANPSYTPYPTNTPYPTLTPENTQTPHVITATSSPTPKFTPTETSTPTITSTPTRTATSTPTPNATKTQQAIINATKGADATATKVAQNAKATEIAQYEKIDYKELTTYPDSHVGEKVWVEGRIFNINGNTELQIYLGWTYDAAYIVMKEPFSGIYEDNFIIVYGEIGGEHCGTNALGARICQPLLEDAFFVMK